MDLWPDRYSGKSGGETDMKFKREGQKQDCNVVPRMVRTFEAVFQLFSFKTKPFFRFVVC